MLNDIHDTLEEIPEQYRELYTQKGEKWECTGISGMKTNADVARVQTGLEKERTAHLATKSVLKAWDGMDSTDVLARLDRMEELEAAAEGKLDDAAIDAMANKRAEGIVKSQIAPLNRQLEASQLANAELTERVTGLSAKADARRLQDQLEPLMNTHKVLAEHRADVLLYAKDQLTMTESGEFFSREGISEGIVAGLAVADWIPQLLDRRQRWLPGSIGGGSKGSKRSVGGGFGANNPFSYDGWNMTAQGAFMKEHGEEKTQQAAAAAGTTVGGMRPEPRK